MSQTIVKHTVKGTRNSLLSKNQKEYHDVLKHIKLYFLRLKLTQRINDRTTGKIDNQITRQIYVQCCYEIENTYSYKFLSEIYYCIDPQSMTIILTALTITSLKRVFDQVGYIINGYVPELYKFSMFKRSHILSIDDDTSQSISHFKKYINLKKIKMDNYNGILTPLQNLKIQEISMNQFRGNLLSLKDAPLKYVRMDRLHIKSIDDFYPILDQELNPWKYTKSPRYQPFKFWFNTSST